MANDVEQSEVEAVVLVVFGDLAMGASAGFINNSESQLQVGGVEALVPRSGMPDSYQLAAWLGLCDKRCEWRRKIRRQLRLSSIQN